jgi:hypothetical protein
MISYLTISIATICGIGPGPSLAGGFLFGAGISYSILNRSDLQPKLYKVFTGVKGASLRAVSKF